MTSRQPRPDRPRLAVRPDTTPAAGHGHLARCLALAQAWTDAHGRATLVADPPGPWRRRYEDEGVEVVATGGGDEGVAAADWLAVDGYRFGPAAGAGARRLLVIDDHGTASPTAADLLLDQNLGASAAVYPHLDGRRLMLGSRYALLRREFRAARPVEPRAPVRVQRLVVSLGGAPAPEVRHLVDEVVAAPALRDIEAVRLEGVDDVPALLATVDLALAAAGSTAWELCCMGVPAVLLPLADNQRPVAARLADLGVAVSVTDAASAVAALTELVPDLPRRQAMGAAGMELVDGLGAPRVVARMRGELLHLRSATEADAELLFEWANDPEVRANAFTSEPIPWQTHLRWLADRLRDPHTLLFVAEHDGRAVGQVRFEGAEISVSAVARGEGWGPGLIDRGVRELWRRTDQREVVARIKPDNRASRRAFEHAGFDCRGARTRGGHTWLQYARRRDADHG